MQLLSTLFPALVLFASVQAGVTPHQPRNGVHILDSRNSLLEFQPFDARAELFDEHALPELETRSELERRLPKNEVGCSFKEIPAKDLATATKMLKQWCKSGYKVNGHNKAVFRYGKAVTFVCSYGNEQGCSDKEFDEALALWNGKCEKKSREGGYVWIPDWAKTYGQGVSGDEICGNLAESDPKQIAAQIGGTILGSVAKAVL
ncbi:hypothetical protein C8J56DRAFT_390492 [Mycena floridula]|nr:hypothetical protein C8J56DRAFT_390492 [Mycena floridula]